MCEQEGVEAVPAGEDHVGVAGEDADVESDENEAADEVGGQHAHEAAADLEVVEGDVAEEAD